MSVGEGALLAASVGAVLELPEGAVAFNGNAPLEAADLGRLPLGPHPVLGGVCNQLPELEF